MRTKQTINNIISMLFFNLIIGALGFWKVNIFVHYLSNDIYSLNQLFYQLFSYIAITDIGFGYLLNKALYNGFAKKDYAEINRVFSTSKKFYNIIGLIMIFIAFILSFFVQYFTKANVNVFYMQIMFIIFIIRNVIDYFFIAQRYVLEADQKFYLINHYVKAIKIIETLIEIVLVLKRVDFLIVLIPGIFISLIINLFINHKIYKYYPWLKNEHTFNKKYLKGTKNVLWHKLSDLLNSNTDIILISTFISPLSVIIYTSYSYITKFICDTIYMMCNAIVPSFANLIITSKEKSYATFKELNIFFLFLASFVFIMLYGFLNSLISFWVGSDYLVNNLTLILFCFITFQLIAQRALVIVVSSKALFKETKNAIIWEAILNISISLVLIKYLGLMGVLLGTIIAKLLTSFWQNPHYIYKNIFKQNSLKYFGTYLLGILISFLGIFMFHILKLNLSTFKNWLITLIIMAIVICLSLFLIFNIVFKSFRSLTKRGLEFIKVRGKYEEN